MGDEYNKRGAWEDAWQQAFDGADHTPGDRVWQGLENSLMEQQVRRYKRKAFLYQWLAAASVALLGLWTGWWLYTTQPAAQEAPLAETAITAVPSLADANETEELAAPTRADFSEAVPRTGGIQGVGPRKSTPPAIPNQQLATGLPEENSKLSGTEQQLALSTSQQEQPVGADAAEYVSENQENPADAILPIFTDKSTADAALAVVQAAESTPDAYELPTPEAAAREARLALAEPRLPAPAQQTVAAMPTAKKNKRKYNGNFWLGASVASTYFSPNMNGGNQSLAWLDQPVAAAKGGNQRVYTANVANWDEKEKSLPSVNFQLEAAWRLGQRWMVQSGLQYGSYKVNTMSGTFADTEGDKMYPLYYSNFSYDKLQTVSANSRMAAPVSALNTYRFMSVPLSFSYVLAERTFGVALSAGLSSNIFLGGQLGDMEQRLDEYEIAVGEDSPFQRVHFNALLGTKLFYRAGPNYLLTLEPTYHYSLTQFNKRSSVFDSKPTSFGVAAGFRFILR